MKVGVVKLCAMKLSVSLNKVEGGSRFIMRSNNQSAFFWFCVARYSLLPPMAGSAITGARVKAWSSLVDCNVDDKIN